jgi:NADPH-dependent curcumin reductase CurA
MRRSAASDPSPSDFSLVETRLPEPGWGQALVRNLWVSVAPYHRLAMGGRYPGAPGFGAGEVTLGETVGRVVESNTPDLAVGDLIVGRTTWEDYVIVDGYRIHLADSHRLNVRKIDPQNAPPSAYLGILGINGFTAYSGLVYLGQPKPGDTLVVSAALGSLGSMVGQIGKIGGCRVIGIAGSETKCRRAVDELGFDICLSYRDPQWRQKLLQAAPDGVDIFFDNVGGDILLGVVPSLAVGARVVMCGFTADYNGDGLSAGPSSGTLIPKQVHMHGLVVWDHMHHYAEMHKRLSRWLREGKVIALDDVAVGLESAPELFCRLMRGETVGKALLHLSENE